MTNKQGNKLALIIAYYLARFNSLALTRLGYNSFNQAFQQASAILDVKKNYIKLSRDEFDPAFTWRRGWIRPMSRQIERIIELFENMEEPEMTEIVRELLSAKSPEEQCELFQIIPLLDPPKETKRGKGVFVLRGLTGKKAEEHFIEYFKTEQLPVSGILEDTRQNGCGYDFKIIGHDQSEYFVEVKGIALEKGGVLFTDKEWKTAQEMRSKYFLVVVRNLQESPELQIIQDPATQLQPKKNIYTTIQVQWKLVNI